ncbi:ABC transporter A family member 1 isoform X4 [Argentina anserina]|uniref:ABC transporter A family member 1 isoform X4 n=1 Tax=Argentina anserina TaxID=57926 RepID=UPI0021766BE6|nr:ABC transporter A family member 1 isoform X4 [Potentilla anserina]
MGTGARQLKAMLRKNWLLKIRHPYVTCAEILLPTVVMLMLIAVRTRVDTQIHPSQPYIRKDMLVEVGKGTSPNFQQVLQLLLKKEEILAFVPDTKATRSMINMMSIIFPLLQRVSRIYKDEEELEAYIRSDLYGTCNQIMNCPNPKIKGAVVFHNQGPQLFDYSIRLNHTWAFSGFPDVKSIMDTNGPYFNDLELGVNTVPTMQYSFSGFLTLQQVLDSFLIFAAQHTKNITLSSLQAPWTQYGPSNIRIVPFPTREYTDDEFQSIIKSVMGVLYLLGFLYPISRLISYSVFEKEQKIREGLYMMGLKDGVFHLSWFIAYALQFAVSSLIITVCTMDNLFKYSDKSVVFIYFFFFGVSAIMLSFLISTFFERAKTAVAVGTLAFLSAFFPYYSVNDEAVPMILKVIASLLSPTAFALGSVNFADYERAHVGLRWSNIWRASSGVNFSVCLLMMLLDALLYCVIGLYLDKVLPRENGVRYPWNFIFQKWFWKTPDINKYHKSSLGVHIRDKVSENAIFSGKENTKAAVEAINFDMRQQELDHRCIQIRNLHKVYASKKGKCCAVNSLQLTMYENQILALLGHNGAGKSTTISMLVGLLRPTSGDAVVFGKNIITDMEEIRKELGVCPQHDILFPELTVKEHLEIFAILKGVQEDFVNSVVVDMVDQSAPTASMAADIVYRHIPSATCVSEVAEHIEGGWIQTFKPSGYKFPNSEKALHDAIEAAGETLGPVLLSMSEFLMSSFNESYQSRYGAVVMDDQNDDGSLGYTVLHNSSCQHAAPTYINLMNTAILRLASRDKNMTIQTRNHPLPMTQSQHLQRHDLDAFSAAVIVSIAFSFIPASFAVPIVKEREVKAKHQQLISGVSILSYWTSAYIWDFISFLFPSSFAIILFYIFGLDQFIGKGCLLSTIVMFLAYGLAIASSTYCLTFFFSDHTMAQNVVLLVHFFTGLILMVISFIMGLIKTTASANSFLKNFFRLSPGFCFADGLASLALLRQDMKNKSSNKAFDWNVTGGSICYLGIESICYFLLALGLEILPFNKLTPTTLKEWWKSRKSIDPDTSSYREPLLTSSAESVTVDLDEDTDVKTERSRVLSGAIDNAIIYLCNLRKVYPGGQPHATKVAVHSLTFSVQEGECFGFLGTNGAGKTTTLSMLTGEEYPTDGSAYIFGKDICSKPKAARQYIGFCPQFDALLEYLTVQEHLELYATIKGVPDFKINEVVMEKLMEFDLLKHASKPSFSLSGGNKRKLSVAIAMIGDPPIVILDEPSTGMDPIAKRFMWEVISRLSTRRGKTAVILTTHSMNEAQALCTRIGIMVGGQLMCIGSPQHLKTRFGNHLELEVKPIEVSSMDLDKLCRVIQERLSHVPSHPRSLLDGLEVCIGATDSIVAENASVAEISLSREMIIMIGRWLGNEERIKPLICPTPLSDGVLGEQLFEQLDRDGGIPLLIFSEWWLSSEKFSAIDSFVLSSFPGAMFQGMNGLSVKYQLPCGPDLSLADVFGHLERKRNRLGIAEYSISQSTLETIFNHFAASP